MHILLDHFTESNSEKHPDVIPLVNSLLRVVMELKSPSREETTASAASRTKHINISLHKKPYGFGGYLVSCPSEQVGFELSKQVKTIYSLAAANNEVNEKLPFLRDILRPKLMTGEIDVSIMVPLSRPLT